MVKKQRPVNLDLTTIQFPPAAIASILHRVSGVAFFVLFAFLLWAWLTSLTSAEGFEQVKTLLSTLFAKCVLWAALSALTYHSLAGIRHLVMDLGHWETLVGGNLSAKIILVLWIVITAATGVWLW